MNPLLIRLYLNARSRWRALSGAPSPPRRMPEELHAAFTMDGRISTLRWYLHDAVSSPLTWTPNDRAWSPSRVRSKGTMYYGQTDRFLYQSLETHPLKGKEVAIVGSESPWYECILTEYGAKVTTIEYRKVHCSIPGLTVLTPDEFAANPRQFDAVVSISSIEHDGLGRYGEPISPDGDVQAMKMLGALLKPGGLLYLAVPIGHDAVVWNAHRIYGRTRFPRLVEGWETVDQFGHDDSLYDGPLGKWDAQPVFVLRGQAA